MLINELINNSDMFFETDFVIRRYDGYYSDTVYDSRKDNDVPWDICMKPISYIGSFVDIGDVPVMIIEYNEEG